MELAPSLIEALAGRYRIERELGGGGMAVVYLAEDLRHRRSVAIKVMRPELAHAAGTERFRREVDIAAGLSHPRILPLIDSGIAADVMWFAMPYVSGGSLRSRMDRDGPLPVADAVLIARGVAGALAHAHRQGVIHRDVKPENILLMDGEPLLSDFGLAHLAAPPAGPRVTMTGMTLGTPGYMSPEQYSGGVLDARTDIYNLGCVFYEMLAGQPPFTGPSAEVVAFQHLNAPPPDVRQLRPLVPEALARAIQRAMAKLAVDRYRTADDFRRAIEDAFAEAAAMNAASANAATQEAMPGATTVRRVSKTLSPRFGLIAGVILLAAALVVAWRVAPRSLHQSGEPAAGAPADSRPMVVLPFVCERPSSSGDIVADVRTLLTNVLDGYGATRCVDPLRVDLAVRSEKSALTNVANALRLAGRLGADRIVQGSIVLIGHRVRLDARLAFQMGGRDTAVTTTAEGDVDSLSRVVEMLARGIIVTSIARTDEVELGLASLDTPPLGALQAYNAGLAEESAASALEQFRRATELDPGFALAWSQLALSQVLLGQADSAALSYSRTLRLGSRLPLRTRLLLEAQAAGNQVEVEQAERSYRQLLAEYPGDAQAWLGLGKELFIINTLRGRRTLEARQPLLEALRLDSTIPWDAVDLLLRIGITIGDVRWTDSLYRAHPNPAGNGYPDPRIATWLAFAGTDTLAQQRILRDASANTTEQLGLKMWGTAEAGEIGPALQFGRMGMEKLVEPNARVFGLVTCAVFAASGGRLREARDYLRAADATDSVFARSIGALLLASAFVPTPAAELDSLARALVRLAGTAQAEDREASPQFLQVEGAVQPIRYYVQGLIATRAGRTADAREMASRLARVTGPAETRVWARNYSLGILAAVDAREARWPKALAKLSQLSLGTKPSGRLAFHILLQERFLHAEALRALGDPAGALAWYECMSEVLNVDHIYLGPCKLAAAEICEQLGRRDEAIRHYRFFCKLWSGCDPELRPTLERAKLRLAALEAQHN